MPTATQPQSISARQTGENWLDHELLELAVPQPVSFRSAIGCATNGGRCSVRWFEPGGGRAKDAHTGC